MNYKLRNRGRLVLVVIVTWQLAIATSFAAGLIVVPAPATTVASTAFEQGHVLKAGPGKLVSLHCYNLNAAVQYILIMNSATVPSNGAVTLLYPPIKIPGQGNFSLVFNVPLTASLGISVTNSSTGSFTKTVGGNDCMFVAQVQ